MRTISSAPPGAQGLAGQSWTARLVVNLKRCWAAYMTWRRQQTAINQLWSMSDIQLKDIGLTRTEIIGAVKGEMVRGRVLRRYHDPMLP